MSNDIPDSSNTVRAALDDAAANVDIGLPSDALVAVRATANARRKRRNVVVGAAAAVTLVAGGVVVANVVDNGSNGDELIVSAPVTEAADDDPTDETAEQPSPDNDTAGSVDAASGGNDATAPTAATETVAAEAEFIAAASSFAGSYQEVFPWKDGFIAIGQTQPEQPLPVELPEEITAAFPAEVVQFFEEAGGLPPTINEAIEMLQEAGLYDAVVDVVTNNADVSNAIYAESSEPPVQFARVSTDGTDWTDIELAVPGEMLPNHTISSTGDRLVAVEQEYEPAGELGDEGPFLGQEQPIAINVRATTDLETWTEQRIELDNADQALPAYLRRGTFVNNIAVNDSGWVLVAETYQSIDYEALLPDDFDRSFLESPSGYSLYHDADGLILQTFDETAAGPEVRIPWADLGLTEAPLGLEGDPFPEDTPPEIWSSSWDGVPVSSPATDRGFGQILGFDGGFIRNGENLSFSTDGVTWVEFDRPSSSGWVSSLMSAPQGVIAFAGDETGSTAYRLDLASLTWTALDEPALPAGFSPWSGAANGALVYSIEEFHSVPDEQMMDETFTLSIVNEDYVLDVIIEGGNQSYTLTDTTTGDVVVSESVDDSLADESPFEFLTEIDDVIEVVSPETGEVVTTFTPEQLADAARATSGSAVEDAPPTTEQPVPTATIVVGEEQPLPEPPLAFEYEQPQLNVLATNGEVWINQSLDLGDLDSSNGAFAQNAVVNNGVVVVAMSEGSLIRLTF